jgi:hypothetical protein
MHIDNSTHSSNENKTLSQTTNITTIQTPTSIANRTFTYFNESTFANIKELRELLKPFLGLNSLVLYNLDMVTI